MLRVEVVQSGHLMPVPKAWSFDSRAGDPQLATELADLLRSGDFFHAEEAQPAPHPDRGMLSIAVETEAGSKRLTFPIDHVPAPLQPLVAFLQPRLAWHPRSADRQTA